MAGGDVGRIHRVLRANIGRRKRRSGDLQSNLGHQMKDWEKQMPPHPRQLEELCVWSICCCCLFSLCGYCALLCVISPQRLHPYDTKPVPAQQPQPLLQGLWTRSTGCSFILQYCCGLLRWTSSLCLREESSLWALHQKTSSPTCCMRKSAVPRFPRCI